MQWLSTASVPAALLGEAGGLRWRRISVGRVLGVFLLLAVLGGVQVEAGRPQGNTQADATSPAAPAAAGLRSFGSNANSQDVVNCHEVPLGSKDHDFARDAAAELAARGAPELDVRKLLWPRPKSVQLQQATNVVDSMMESAGLLVKPLLVQPEGLAFHIEGGIARDTARRAVHRVCRRLWAAAAALPPSDIKAAHAERASAPSGATHLVTLRVLASAAGGGESDTTPPGLTANESYKLTVGESANSSSLEAMSRHGLNRGLETLVQVLDALMVASRPSASQAEGFWKFAPGVMVSNGVPTGSGVALHIQDEPIYPWRGLLVDTARHYLPVEALEQVLSAMAANKLNVMHWHLTDAVSFPLELPSLPQLARKGAFDSKKIYKASDVRRVVEYASRLSIRVVPELDMPAHTGSWVFGEPDVVSNCKHVRPGNPEDAANPFKQRDKLALDPSSNKLLDVVRTALSDLAAMFPDEFIHVGGDEVDYDCWETMPKIKKWMRKNRMNSKGVLKWFFKAVFEKLGELKKNPIIWQEAFLEGVTLPPGGVVQPWQCWGDIDLGATTTTIGHMTGHMAAARQHRVVQSSCWYLDWDSQWTDFYGHSADEADQAISRSRGSPLPYAKAPSFKQGLLGGEAALWTERIDFTNVACRTWPRTAAIAERLWSSEDESHFLDGSFSVRRGKDMSPRLLWHAHRLRRLYGVALKPLKAASGSHEAAFTAADLARVQHTCPLLASQALQRSKTDSEWADAFEHGFLRLRDEPAVGEESPWGIRLDL
eukprot:TRINITY_DN80887_c0_g1_i1.p1 TRINITY_DN80887_c0_g1~~TRINITY_DN80887_c0_g1_i1.p1  ORF type:complete len:771 (+),score=167.72 TRINITY_DN80887_c0_g1_i1:86-2398(+)